MNLREIIRTKGGSVYSIGPDTKLSDVVDMLVKNNCGSLVVCHAGGEMLGIITERDILRACAAKAAPLDALATADHMTKDVVTGQLDDPIGKSMGMLTEKRIRHLPILEEGKLAGMISIGDLVKAQYAQLSVENHYLKNYIQS